MYSREMQLHVAESTTSGGLQLKYSLVLEHPRPVQAFFWRIHYSLDDKFE